jgi:hypothetical protein
MKLHIENWIEEKGYSINIKELFKESVICYRNSAYRASLLFSYVAFLTIIKETLLKAKRPAGFSEAEWTAILSKINNERTWEEEVYKSLINGSKPIFLISEDLRDQIKYWKNRRNDCAHIKDNEIASHHTEAFWSFLKSNVPKMTVEGGMLSLLLKFDDHFDQTQTARGTDYSHLIYEIENSVLVSEFPEFFKSIYTVIEHRLFYESETLQVYDKILDLLSSKIQEALINYLKVSKKDVTFLLFYPEKIMQFGYSPKEIRKIWFERMLLVHSAGNPFNLYAVMLRNNLIPKGEIEQANKSIFNKFSQQSNSKIPENKDIDTFKANGFFQTIFDIAITEKDLRDFVWVNGKCDLIGCFIENYPLNSETVSSIISMSQHRNPSQWLVKRIQNIFISIPELKSEFTAIASRKSLALPPDFS